MTLAQLEDRLRSLQTEITELHEGSDGELKEGDQKRFDSLISDYETAKAQYQEEKSRTDKITQIVSDDILRDVSADTTATNGTNKDRSIRIEGVNVDSTKTVNVNTRTEREIWDLDSLRDATPNELKGRVKTALERCTELPSYQGEQVSKLLKRDNRQRQLARHIILTGSEAYRTGFQQLMAEGPENALYTMTEDQKKAIGAARTALSLSAAAGGYAVPFTLDPTIISLKDIGTNPIRMLASQRSIVTDQWNGLTSAGVTASYVAEATEATDNSPALAQPTINVHRAHAFVLGSIEITQDWPGIEEDLSTMFTEARDDLEALKFVSGAGDGSNEPQGIVTGLDGTASEIAPGTAETFNVVDMVNLPKNVQPKYRRADLSGRIDNSQSAVYLANFGTYTQVKTANAALGDAKYEGLWVDLGGGVQPRLNGFPAYESSDMDSSADINAGATADNFVAVFGNVNRGYRIIDRVGMVVEYIPHVFGTTANYPTGQRAWYAYWRNGAEVININALVMLSIPTTA